MIALVAWAQLKDSKMSTLLGSIIVTVPDEVAVVISQYVQLSAIIILFYMDSLR